MSSFYSSNNSNNKHITATINNCTVYLLGYGSINHTLGQHHNETILLNRPALFVQNCTDQDTIELLTDMVLSSLSSTVGRDPFHGSVVTIAFAASCAVTIEWLLFILLFISKKRRPFFIQFATLFTAISLTVIVKDFNDVLIRQYYQNYRSTSEMRQQVTDGDTYNTLWIVSTFVLWLAQIQVLIRLHPPGSKANKYIVRIGIIFAGLNGLFWCLRDFYAGVPFGYPSAGKELAINCLTYVTQLSLHICYFGLLFLYSIKKWRFAYHRRAIPIAAITLSITALPAIFFILSISKGLLSIWSEFCRWVSTSAACVVAWEWINVIEKLESDYQKAGVLGREINDETLNDYLSVDSSSDKPFIQNANNRKNVDEEYNDTTNGDGITRIVTNSALGYTSSISKIFISIKTAFMDILRNNTISIFNSQKSEHEGNNYLKTVKALTRFSIKDKTKSIASIKTEHILTFQHPQIIMDTAQNIQTVTSSSSGRRSISSGNMTTQKQKQKQKQNHLESYMNNDYQLNTTAVNTSIQNITQDSVTGIPTIRISPSDTSPPPEEVLPDFEPAPGFTREDYWDDKDPQLRPTIPEPIYYPASFSTARH